MMNETNRRCGCHGWRGCACSGGALCFLIFVFAVALGLIFGTLYAQTLLVALDALIVFAAVIAAVIVALMIYLCRRKC